MKWNLPGRERMHARRRSCLSHKQQGQKSAHTCPLQVTSLPVRLAKATPASKRKTLSKQLAMSQRAIEADGNGVYF